MSRPSTDKDLLWLAKSALDIVWPELTEEIQRLHVVNTAGGAKMPKHTKELPTGDRHHIVGFSLSGKYRPLAYVKRSIHAAVLADCVAIRLDEFLKRGIRTDPGAQAAYLNFPIVCTQAMLADNESLSSWWSEVMSHLLTSEILVESAGSAKFLRSGRPQNADTIARLRDEITECRKQFVEVNRKLDLLLDRQPTTVIVGPGNPVMPCAPAIGWPLPAGPTSPTYPIITCGDAANAPKAT